PGPPSRACQEPLDRRHLAACSAVHMSIRRRAVCRRGGAWRRIFAVNMSSPTLGRTHTRHRRQIKLLSVPAAALLPAACSAAPRDSADADAASRGGALDGTSQTSYGSAAPGTQEELRQTIGDLIFFDFDSYSVRPDQRRIVEQVAQWMNQHQNVQLTIEGHADERGTREYNLALGDRRANSVRSMLVSLGVPSSRLSTISYGKERPRSEERRVGKACRW